MGDDVDEMGPGLVIAAADEMILWEGEESGRVTSYEHASGSAQSAN